MESGETIVHGSETKESMEHKEEELRIVRDE